MDRGQVDRQYLGYLREQGLLEELPEEVSFEAFMGILEQLYSGFTLAWAEAETGVPADTIAALWRYLCRYREGV